MSKQRVETTYETMLAARLRWALESTIIHFLGKPDRNAIEDWSEALSIDMGGERAMWQRSGQPALTQPDQTVGEARKNGKVTATTT
ncbi:MAG TPA: hypothetical protein EYO33_30035 [Phycisphaerales bacterium]|nr:hypothetical protein [Phycisphaerales bacterium]